MLALVLGLGVLVGLSVTTAGPAAAAPGAPFQCPQGTVFIGYNAPTRLDTAVQGPDGVTFEPERAAAGIAYNSLSFHQPTVGAEGYLYALKNNSTELLQIGKDGDITSLGNVAGLEAPGEYNQGTFGTGAYANTMFVRSIERPGRLYMIDVTQTPLTATFAQLSSPQPPNLSDIVFIDGYVWGFIGEPLNNPTSFSAWRMDPAGGAGSAQKFDLGMNLGGSGIYGGQWAYGNGDMGVSDNVSGKVHRIRITDGDTATPTFTKLVTSNGPSTSNNDAASCIGMPTDLSIDKAGPATYADGDTLSYTLKVKNNGPSGSSGSFVSDKLPAGLTNAATSTPGCDIVAGEVSCILGPLAVDDEYEITYTAKATAPGDIVNTAEVVGNEAEPNPDGHPNTSTSTATQGTAPVACGEWIWKEDFGQGASANERAALPAGQTTYTYASSGGIPDGSYALMHDTNGSGAGTYWHNGPDHTGNPLGRKMVVNANDQTAGAFFTTTVDGLVPGASYTFGGWVANADAVPVQDPVNVKFTVQDASDNTVVGQANTGDLHEDTTQVVWVQAGAQFVAPASGSVKITAANNSNRGAGNDLFLDDLSVVLDCIDKLELEKSAELTTDNETAGKADAGDVITYTFKVKNTGNRALTDVAVTDDLPGLSAIAPTKVDTLAVGAETTFTATYPVTEADVAAGGVTNTATAGGKAPGGADVTSEPDTATVPAPAKCGDAVWTETFGTGTGRAKLADGLTTYTYKASGYMTDGDYALMSVVDGPAGTFWHGGGDHTGDLNGRKMVVNANEQTAGAFYTTRVDNLVPGATYSFAGWVANAGNSANGGNVPVNVKFSVKDASNGADLADANTGNLGRTNPMQWIQKGAQFVAPASGSVTIIASNNGLGGGGNDLFLDDLSLVLDCIDELTLEKTSSFDDADNDGKLSVGEVVTYTFTVTNKGNRDITDVTVADPLDGLSPITPASIATLAPGASEAFTATYTATQDDVDAGKIENTATANGDGPDGPLTGTDTETLPVPQDPKLALDKSASLTEDEGTAGVGDEDDVITYTFRVTNTGNVSLSDVKVADSLPGLSAIAPASVNKLAPGEAAEFTATYTVTAADVTTGKVDNTATAGGKAPSGADVDSDPGTATVPTVPAPAQPYAKPDTSTGAPGQPQSVDPLANDTPGEKPFDPATLTLLDDNGDPVESVTVPGEGTYTVVDGKLVFTPVDGFTGTATPVTYQVKDEDGNPATSTYTPTVTPAPAKPVAKPDTSTGAQGQPQSVDPLANDEPGAKPFDPATLTLLDDNGDPVESVTVPGEGTYTVVDGKLVFTPEPGFTGTATPVTYQVKDEDGNPTTSTYTPTVTPAAKPKANPDTSKGAPGQPQSVDPLANDNPGAEPFDPATLTLLDGNGDPVASVTVPGEGTYTLVDGKLVFTPVDGFTGTATPVKYQVKDTDGNPTESTYTPTVVPLDELPLAQPDTSTGVQGKPQSVDPLANDIEHPDRPFDPATLTLLDGNGDPVAKVTVPGEGEYTVVDGKLVFTPEPGFTGTATPVTYQIADSSGEKVTSTYTPTVTPAPKANPDTSTGAQGEPQSVNPLANDAPGAKPFDPATLTLLDGDGDPVESVVVPGEGTYTVNDGKIVFTPLPEFTGTATPVGYQVKDTDGNPTESTYTPTVVALEDLPLAKPDTATGVQGKPQSVDPLANDIAHPDHPFVPATLTLLDGAGNPTDQPVVVPNQGTYTVAGGKIVFTPLPEFTGEATPVKYQVEDEAGTTVESTYTPTVTPAPKANPDTSTGVQGQPQSVNPLANDTPGAKPFNPATLTLLDGDGKPVDKVIVPDQGTYTVDNGKLVFTPLPGFTGTATPVTYEVKDTDGNPTTSTYTPTVTPAPSTEVAGTVWIDADRDGVRDPEEKPLPGVVLEITGPDGKPVTDVNGNPVGPVTTDANGNYVFANLPVLPDGQKYTVKVNEAASKAALNGLVLSVDANGNFAYVVAGDSAVKATPKIKTKGLKPVLIKKGTKAKLRDKITITGFVPGSNAQGIATLYGPAKKRSNSMCKPGKAVATVKFNVRNGTFKTKAVKVSKAGVYTWVVATTADANNNAGTHACGLKSETVTVKKLAKVKGSTAGKGDLAGTPATGARTMLPWF